MDSSAVLVSVAGQPIRQGHLDYYVKHRSGTASSAVSAEAPQSSLIELEQLHAAAKEGERFRSPEISQELELRRLETLAHYAAERAGVFNTPSEAELAAAYAEWRVSLSENEYHVAHILLATESDASVVITRLQAGYNFATLARETSEDDSKIRGGDLGWIAAGKLPKEFMIAVQSLRDGAVYDKPVHTRYGWHAIRRLETRQLAVSSLESLEPQLVSIVQRAKYQHFLEESLKKNR